MTLLQTLSPDTGVTAVRVALVLSYLSVTVGAAVLLAALTRYVRGLLAESYREHWLYLGVGVGAAVVYGVSGVLEVTSSVAAARTFKIGATLFFFLFLAVGVRELYFLEVDRPPRSSPSAWVAPGIIVGFVLAWWVSYLLGRGGVLAFVETVGLAGATLATIVYAVRTVRVGEGTSVAAVVRQLLPALLAFAVVVVAEQAGQYVPVHPGVVLAVELVGTALVGAFLFTTAVAIRQESGEVERMYDRTTWRGV